MVVEYCECGSLKDILHRARESEAAQMQLRRQFIQLPEYCTTEPVKTFSNFNVLPQRSLTNRDLLKFSFDVSCGMEYIASKRVIKMTPLRLHPGTKLSSF